VLNSVLGLAASRWNTAPGQAPLQRQGGGLESSRRLPGGAGKRDLGRPDPALGL